jgi:hypothetical protein
VKSNAALSYGVAGNLGMKIVAGATEDGEQVVNASASSGKSSAVTFS